MTKFESRNPFTQTRLARRLAAALAIGVAGGAMSVALVAPAHAQESTASLRGQVTGAQGISQVTAVEVNTGVRRTVAAGAGGNYNFASLRPGTYRLEVTTADGVRISLHLAPGSRTGYRGVERIVRRRSRGGEGRGPAAAFRVHYERRGKRVKLPGTFATAVDAAVAYAQEMRRLQIEV